MKKLVLFIFALQILNSIGQITLENRLEFDLKSEENILKTFPIGKKGLVTLSVELIKGANYNYLISKYDLSLNKVKAISFEKEARLYSTGIFPNTDTTELICLFENKKEWVIKKIDLMGFSVSETRFNKSDLFFKTIEKLDYCVDGKLFFQGIRKKRPALMILDIENRTDAYQEIPGINRSRTIESVRLDKNFQNVLIFQRDGKDLKKALMSLIIMDINGSFSRPFTLDKNPELSIIDGEITWLDENSFILAGTYGLSRKSIVSSGYYISKFEFDHQVFITYHSFSDFENYFNFLPERTQKRIEKKKERKKSRGQTDFIRTRIALHPVIVMEGVYRIVGEVYYPTYRTETYTTTGANGMMTTSTRQVFDGYQYSHAAILDTDENGNKLKDYCFKMYLAYKPFTVIRNLRIQEDGRGNMHFIFVNGGNIRAASISKDQRLSETDFGTIHSDLEGDKVRWTGLARSVYWYDNVYLLYGTQLIKNKENENVKKRRTVYFINKISYHAKW